MSKRKPVTRPPTPTPTQAPAPAPAPEADEPAAAPPPVAGTDETATEPELVPLQPAGVPVPEPPENLKAREAAFKKRRGERDR